MQTESNVAISETAPKNLAGKECLFLGRGLNKKYGGLHALRDVDLTMYRGEILALVGDNGAGKSTLNKAISGAIVPDSGSIEFDGTPVTFTRPTDATAVGIETVGKNRAGRRTDVHHVQAAPAGSRSHQVGKACVLVDDNVMGPVELSVHRVGGEGLRRIDDGAQASQVENLHAVRATVIRDNESVVGEDLDVAPRGGLD